MSEEFKDKDLGTVCVVHNIRAKSVIARKKLDKIQLTVPVYFTISQIKQAFEQLRPRLLTIQIKSQIIFQPDTIFNTLTFSLKIEKQQVKNFHVSLKDQVLHIICPDILDLSDTKVQNMIQNSIEIAMRSEAKRVFPSKVETFAKIYGFTYTNVSINKSRSRWGSCSSKKSINLSYFCLLLPEYLLDFVILHELCHTVEMNHGEKFWKMLDKVTKNRARLLTLELKNYSTSF